MMGGYLVYLNGKLIGDICDNVLFLKRTPTVRLLADFELRYPYKEGKCLKLAREIKELVDDMVQYADWSTRDDIKTSSAWILLSCFIKTVIHPSGTRKSSRRLWSRRRTSRSEVFTVTK